MDTNNQTPAPTGTPKTTLELIQPYINEMKSVTGRTDLLMISHHGTSTERAYDLRRDRPSTFTQVVNSQRWQRYVNDPKETPALEIQIEGTKGRERKIRWHDFEIDQATVEAFARAEQGL